jgi:hypothetical protein
MKSRQQNAVILILGWTIQFPGYLRRRRDIRVSPEMAVRLAAVVGSTPAAWLAMQAAYDLARAVCRAGQDGGHGWRRN